MYFETSLFVNTGWQRMPFLRLIIPLLAGIATQYQFSFSAWSIGIFLLVLILFYAIYNRLPPSVRYAWNWLQTSFLLLIVFFVGALLLYHADGRHQFHYYQQHYHTGSKLLLRITAAPEEKPRSWRFTATVMAVADSAQLTPASGDLLLYLRKDSLPPLQYGDMIMVQQPPEEIRNSGNPGAFDYRLYCALQGIYGQLQLRRTDYQLLSQRRSQSLEACLIRMRSWCLQQLRHYIGSGPEAGMAAALLIGYRQDLDRDIVQDYTNTGIVHIIAISGMHLALLYGSLLWLLKWWPAKRFVNIIKAVLVLLALWGFALLTGASASVLRSAVMFTGITIGSLVLERYSSAYNTLAASAFLLLCYNPCFAMDVGFQLSYLAVLSIMLFYQPIRLLVKMKNRWADLLWEMLSLSIAAQILTTPVSLFYFHQFPNYFLVANLVAVPLSTVIIYGEILLLAVAFLSPLATWVGVGLRWLIWFMNACVKWLGALPGALTPNIHCSALQMTGLYLLIAGMALWLLAKWKPGAWLAGIGLLLCCGLHAQWQLDAASQRRLVIYNVAGYTLIDGVQGRSVQLIGDDSISTGAAQTLQAARSSWGASPGKVALLAQHGHYLSFCGKRLVIIDTALPSSPPQKKFCTDYILLTHNPHVDISRLGDFFTFHTIILGAANTTGRIKKWKNDCYALTLRCFSVPDQGAYVINF
ncbi:ComEC/Rec2 family competence protein [Chitinophaga vietnamensis]|uniref:ComEC/Rec2 family competence protein n=1 Tax=Chitinophaga vietnamensis TaxID=2593957 RepID=UPI0011775645|nr:ComEC/Rec2 family competence protein [Chitinophaga vietnamensis]